MSTDHAKAAAALACLAEYDASPRDERVKRGIPIPLIRRMLDACGIEYPVRFEHADVPEDPQDDEELKSVTPDIYIVPAGNNGERGGEPKKRGNHKVEHTEHHGLHGWTCSCPGWAGNHRACRHIKKIMRQLGIPYDPYATARRRPPTRWLYPQGAIGEDTRRRNARHDWPRRVRELFDELLQLVVRERPRGPRADKKPLGAKGLLKQATVWCLFEKLFRATTYPELIADLRNDMATLWRLGWTKSDPPSMTTLSRRFADETLVEEIASMVPITAEAGRHYAVDLMIDSDEIPSSQMTNSREQKSGVKPASFRSKAAMVVRHHVSCVISSLVGAMHLTLDRGHGTADAPHLPALAEAAKSGPFPETKTLSGDQAYGAKRNYRECMRLGILLYVYSKINERRYGPDSDWPQMAQEMARMEHEHAPLFHEVRRYRNKGEGLGARSVRLNPFVKLRGRKNQPDVVYPPEVLELFAEQADTEGQTGEKKRTASLKQGLRISDLPEPAIASILLGATQAVGAPRLNEVYLATVILNLRAIVTMEHLTGDGSRPDRVSFRQRKWLRLIPTVKESAIRVTLARIAAQTT
jgi:hypothetical protein